MTAADKPLCPSCGAVYGPDDIFCESCGYDFITGSMPRADEQFGAPTPPAMPGGPDPAWPAPAPATGEASAVGAPATMPTPLISGLVKVEVAISRPYFDAVVSEGELTFPDDPPQPQQLELAGPEVHIGRTSRSRAIHPDIDVAALTGDPAVSSRHAVLRVDPIGTMAVTDVGSTNGTYIDDYAGAAVTPGVATLLTPGGVIYVGAWTSLTVSLA
ncbi:MAG: FHA domain-containing protein [Actinomycetota bacterium]